MRVKNAWKDPSHCTKYPVPIVLTIAASVPAEFEIPVSQVKNSLAAHRGRLYYIHATFSLHYKIC